MNRTRFEETWSAALQNVRGSPPSWSCRAAEMSDWAWVLGKGWFRVESFSISRVSDEAYRAAKWARKAFGSDCLPP